VRGAKADEFTQLGSPRNQVVTASVRELDYQCEIMDRMGLDQDGVMMWVVARRS
jgi:UV DNA damage endonuclease